MSFIIRCYEVVYVFCWYLHYSWLVILFACGFCCLVCLCCFLLLCYFESIVLFGWLLLVLLCAYVCCLTCCSWWFACVLLTINLVLVLSSCLCMVWVCLYFVLLYWVVYEFDVRVRLCDETSVYVCCDSIALICMPLGCYLHHFLLVADFANCCVRWFVGFCVVDLFIFGFWGFALIVGLVDFGLCFGFGSCYLDGALWYEFTMFVVCLLCLLI